MKKLIKLDFNNTTKERKTEDSYSELYSHDKNNGSFEFEILNDTLTTEQVIALFKFTESNKVWKTTGTVEGNKIHVTFDTSLITQNETVICYLYFDEEQRTSDTFRFKFKVKVSEIDKMSRYEVKERFINNTVIVDRLDVVTKDELKEALSKIQISGGVDLSNYLTTTEAEETFATKQEIPNVNDFVRTNDLTEAKKSIVDEIKNLGYAKATEVPAAYNDSELSKRVTNLENKADKDTVYDDSDLKNRVKALEDRPINTSNDTSPAKNFVTKDELNTIIPNQTLSLNNNILSISGGNSVVLPSNKPLTGNGSPDGKVVANPGDTYVNNNVSLGDYFYYKERNPGRNTGWKVLYGSMGVNVNLTTGGRIRFARENYFVNASISDLTISLEALNSGQGRDFYQEGENVVIRFISIKQFDARESIIPQGFRPIGNFLVPAYSKSGDSIGLFKFEQTYGVVKLILNDITLQNVTSEMLKGINSGLIVYPTQEAWMTTLP
nr:MAG TPA: hypothetical protein [Caudoviricetes sp.]